MKGRILRDIKNLFEHDEEEENCYKPESVSNFQSNNYIEYESNGDRNKTLPGVEYLNKSRPYLKDLINNLRKSGKWKIQLTMANSFISSLDIDEEHVKHSKSNNTKIMINDNVEEVIKELFDLLKNRYQNKVSNKINGRQ